MKQYEVLNPFLAFRINENQKDYALKRGDVVELPEANPAVRAMVVRRQIREATEPIPTPADPGKGKKK